MLLSDRDIRAGIDAGTIVLDPWDPQMVQPASVDVRLDRYFRLFDNHRYPSIDPSQEQPELTHLIETAPDEAFILHPGEFVLAATYEQVTLGNGIAARLEGKSSLGRLGLLTHSTAGFIDPGFQGHVTLELSNVATLPIKLWPGLHPDAPDASAAANCSATSAPVAIRHPPPRRCRQDSGTETPGRCTARYRRWRV